MIQLENTKIYRGGVTQRKRGFATNRCSLRTLFHPSSLRLEFSITSAGRGDTGLLLDIGTGDLAAILEAVADAFPESSFTLFNQCAAHASEKVLGRLALAEKQVQENKAWADDLRMRLEPVEAFVGEKFYEAPADHDKREGEVRDLLAEVTNSLLHASI